MALQKLPMARPDTVQQAIEAAERCKDQYSKKLKNHGVVKDFQEANQRCIRRLKKLQN